MGSSVLVGGHWKDTGQCPGTTLCDVSEEENGMIRIHVQYRGQNRGCGQATLGLSSSPASPCILFLLK